MREIFTSPDVGLTTIVPEPLSSTVETVEPPPPTSFPQKTLPNASVVSFPPFPSPEQFSVEIDRPPLKTFNPARVDEANDLNAEA